MQINTKVIVLALPILFTAAAANGNSCDEGNLLANMRWCVDATNNADGRAEIFAGLKARAANFVKAGYLKCTDHHAPEIVAHGRVEFGQVGDPRPWTTGVQCDDSVHLWAATSALGDSQ